MHPEEIEKVKKLIQQTNILSAMEKAEWLQLIGEMNDKQVADLVGILTPHPHPKPAPAPVPLPPKVDIHQKEIGTSVPFYELEIPAHLTPAKKVPAPVDPTDLQNRVSSIVKEMQQKKEDVPAPIPAAPKHVPFTPAAKSTVKLDLKTAEDFSKLTPEQIHGADPDAALQSILVAMAEIGKKNQIYEIIMNLEKSPLYKAYMDTGFAMLNDPTPDRDVAYDAVTAKFQRAGQPWLSKQEFEAFTDFRNRLDQMV